MKKAGTSGTKSVEDLLVEHNSLGFAASELIENVARPMEKKWAAAKAAEAKTAPCFVAPNKSKFIADLKVATNETLNSLGYTVADSFSRPNWKKGLTHVTKTTIKNAVNTVTTTASAVTKVTKSLVSSTTSTVKCAANAVKSDLTSIVDSISRQHQHDLRREFATILKTGSNDGPFRFSLNDSVEKVQLIFSHCDKQTQKKTAETKSIDNKFGPSNMQVFKTGKVYQTLVADGWTFEARVADASLPVRATSVWTNVLVKKGDFELELKRGGKNDFIYAEVNGMSMGAI